jgi:hypothetical protein
MRTNVRRGLLISAALLMATGVRAQEPRTEPAAEGATADSVVELAFDRETFTYPEFVRRNPFRPLVTAEAGGPRYEQLHLLGIIQAEDPSESVVLFGVGEMPEVDEEGRSEDTEAAQGQKIETFRLRRGDVIGNPRVLEIQRSQITVEVEEFGLTERRTLALPRPDRGGTS